MKVFVSGAVKLIFPWTLHSLKENNVLGKLAKYSFLMILGRMEENQMEAN